MKNKILIITVFVLLFSSACDIFKRGSLDDAQLTEEFIEGDIFIESIDFYERFLIDNPDDADFNYKLGFALLNTKNKEKESIEYFERAKNLYDNRQPKLVMLSALFNWQEHTEHLIFM